jgi:hypothetical protein
VGWWDILTDENTVSKNTQKLGMATHFYNPSYSRLRQENCKLEVRFGYLMSSRPAWATKQDLVSK